MEKKTVSALQEFCAKTGKSAPIYEYTVGSEGSYICKVTAVNMKSQGNGRTKREAKQLAAENIWRKLSNEPRVGMEIQNMDRDMVKELFDYCRLHKLSKPKITAEQQSGSGSGPEFVVTCSVGSVVRNGKSDNQKFARQRAASKVLDVISNKKPDADVEPKDLCDVTAETRKTFEAFKKLTDAGRVDSNAMRICDRHNYFKRFCPALKEAAFEVIRSDKYESTKDKAMSLMSALKLTPTIGTVDSTSEELLLKVDVNCEFDCLILGMESEIYGQIIRYFQDMLV